MTKNFIRIICFSFSLIAFDLSPVSAQYYYKDILSTEKLNNEFSILKNSNIKFIKISSFDENDQPSPGFLCEKKFNKDFTQSEMVSQSNITSKSLLITEYNNKGQVTRTTSTTPYSSNIVEFDYDTSGHIILIRTNTKGDDDSTSINETHEYTYGEKGNPIKMLRKRNNKLVSTITFVTGDKGNIIEEDASGNSTDKKYYYYYDDSNRLTDVVHYNVIARRLLPDYMFQYKEGDQPDQMISVDETGRNYYIWRYAYDGRRLPEIQKCYSKEKRLLGTIQYDYK